MKNILIILFVILSGNSFSQTLKEISVQDSIEKNYQGRKKMSKEIANIFSKSEISKDAVKSKLKNIDFKTVTKNQVDVMITYYQNHYFWILFDNTLKNFSDDEISKIEKSISKNKTEDPLFKKFRLVENTCVEYFDKNF